MEGEFPYLKIDPKLHRVVGKREDDNRIFRQTDDFVGLYFWLEELRERLNGDLIPTTWVPEYVCVSRAAVHKRIEAGRLTVFVFELEEPKKTWTLKYAYKKKAEFSYCVLSECKAWREEVLDRIRES